ncbi:tetratricopeptide repeat protein [Candidatus Poribacteria bacterium]|nr:tetratricopeptide repeat protein [Candidatus Poribacteria bacterium]
MKYLSILTTIVLITACLALGANLQAQTAETPELLSLTDVDTGLNADMTRTAGIYTNLMWATYCKTDKRKLHKSKTAYDALITELKFADESSTFVENEPLSAQGVSFIYAERAVLRFSKLQDINGAEEDAEKAIQFNPENVNATWILAKILTTRFISQVERDRNSERAVDLKERMFATLKRVVELNPDHDEAHFYLGSMARDFEEPELAIKAFKALTRIIPYDPRYHTELAKLYERQNRFDEALQSYERVVTIQPQQMNTRNHLGQLYLQTGDYPAAIKTFLTVLASIEGSPNRISTEIEAHHGISLAYQAQNNFEKAEHHITRAVTLLETRALSMRGGTRSNRSRRAEINALAQSLQDARYTLAQIYLRFNRPQKAVDAFAKILATDANYVPALTGIGIAYQMIDDLPQAETYLRKAIDLSANGELPDAYNALGYLYAEQGIKLDEAAALVRRALKSVPTSGAYLDSLGLIYFKQGKLDAAIENLEQALKYMPDTPEILLHLADAYLEKGLEDKALETLEAAVQLEPDNAELRQKLDTIRAGR